MSLVAKALTKAIAPLSHSHATSAMPWKDSVKPRDYIAFLERPARRAD